MKMLGSPVHVVKFPIRSKQALLVALVVAGLTMALVWTARGFISRRPSAHEANSAAKKQRKCCADEPAIPRRMIGTYYTTEDGFQSALVLNNKGPKQIMVTPILHSQNGQTFTASPVAVSGQSSSEVNLNSLASIAGPQFRFGSFEFTYEGRLLEVGGGLRIVNAGRSLIFDEQMLEPGMKFPSSQLEAVYAVPFEDSQVNVIITNTTMLPIIVKGDTTFVGANGHHAILNQLGPYETQVVNLPHGLAKNASAGGVSLNHNGGKGALMAMIHIWDADRGYSETVNFTNPVGKTTERHGAGLRLGSVKHDPLKPVIAVRNIGESATIVTTTVPYSKQNGDAGTISLPQIALAPGEIKLLDTSSPRLRQNDFTTAGLEIRYTGAPGSVIASASSVSRSGNHVFALPMKDPKGGLSSAGGYPWFINGFSSTVVFIKNTTNEPQRFHLDIVYQGGRWGSNLKTLAPGQTTAFDVRKIRDAQDVGSEGNTIPSDAAAGHVAWTVYGNRDKVLIGRAQTVNFVNGLASTYECQCCGSSFSDVRLAPGAVSSVPGYTMLFTAQQQDVTCHGDLMSWFNVPIGDVTFSSENSNVAVIDAGGNATAVGLGSTFLHGGWTVVERFFSENNGCEMATFPADSSASCEVKPFCEGKPLCTACEPSGSACDGMGACRAGANLIPQICSQLGLTYANQRTPSCTDGTCGAVIEYNITKVTHSCDSISLVGAKVTETITTDNGCGPGSVQVGPGCPIDIDNTLQCKDTYSLCAQPSSFPDGTCTEVYTQKLFVGQCNAETRTITFKITKTSSTSCSGTATRN